MTRSQRRLLLLFYVGPLVLWMGFIFTASTTAGSGENSGRLLRWLLETISPDQARNLSEHTLSVLNIVVRKMGHVTEYAILTMLAVRAIQFGSPYLKKSAVFGAFAISALYACSDELHQRFVPGRGASPIDVAIDLSGVALVMIGILFWFGLKSWERRLLTSDEGRTRD
jgi:VanZ family protein